MIARLARLALCLVIAALAACASVPPEVAQVHQKELETIESLRKSYVALVDTYVDKKLAEFEAFYFRSYGPSYLKNWKSSFRKNAGREYDEAKDFGTLYNDLVAEYQEVVKPIQVLRVELKTSINNEFSNVIESHRAVDRWIKSIGELQAANKASVDKILGSFKPGLSVDHVEQAIDGLNQKIRVKLQSFQ